jgi:FixJ family two-component response regulator
MGSTFLPQRTGLAIDLLCAGMDVSVVAALMGITPATVKSHRAYAQTRFRATSLDEICHMVESEPTPAPVIMRSTPASPPMKQ